MSTLVSPFSFAGAEGLLRLAILIDTEMRLALADRASMRRSGAVLDLGSVNGTNSDSARETFVGLDGYDSFATTAAEDTDVAATNLTVNTADIAVVRAAMRRDVGDLFVLTGQGGRNLDPSRLASSMAGEWDAYWMQTLCDTADGFSAAVGNTGSAMTMDDFHDAVFTLEESAVPGPFYALLHNHQWTGLTNSIRGETGPAQFLPALAEALAIKGPGFKGTLHGVEIFASNKVNSSGGARYGAMWGVGAIGMKRGAMEPPPGATIVRPDAEIVVEFQRDASRAITEIVGHGYLGMGILEQSRGVVIHTTAS